jgi:hypothetical protein
MNIQKISAAFYSLLNFGNFGLVIQKRWRKSISQLPSRNGKEPATNSAIDGRSCPSYKLARFGICL